MNAPLNHPLPLLDLDFSAPSSRSPKPAVSPPPPTPFSVRRRPSPCRSRNLKNSRPLVFSRDARSVTLTTDGEMLLGYARRMLAINREAVSKFIIPEIIGVVRIGSPDDYGERVLPHVLKRFAQSHPSIAVDVVIDQSSNLRRRMDDRALDITLVTNSSKIRWPAPKSAHRTDRLGRRQGRLRASEGAAAGLGLGRGLRLARRRARCAGPRRPQLPRRLYERPHGRPARGHHGRSRGSAVAEFLPRRRHGGTRRKDGLPEIGKYSLAMFVAPDASAPIKAAADHIRATFEFQPDRQVSERLAASTRRGCQAYLLLASIARPMPTLPKSVSLDRPWRLGRSRTRLLLMSGMSVDPPVRKTASIS